DIGLSPCARDRGLSTQIVGHQELMDCPERGLNRIPADELISRDRLTYSRPLRSPKAPETLYLSPTAYRGRSGRSRARRSGPPVARPRRQEPSQRWQVELGREPSELRPTTQQGRAAALADSGRPREAEPYSPRTRGGPVEFAASDLTPGDTRRRLTT